MEDFKKYLEEMREEARAEIEAAQNEENKENFDFYSGFNAAINAALDFITNGTKRNII